LRTNSGKAGEEKAVQADEAAARGQTWICNDCDGLTRPCDGEKAKRACEGAADCIQHNDNNTKDMAVRRQCPKKGLPPHRFQFISDFDLPRKGTCKIQECGAPARCATIPSDVDFACRVSHMDPTRAG